MDVGAPLARCPLWLDSCYPLAISKSNNINININIKIKIKS
jgi:hypothetical protein